MTRPGPEEGLCKWVELEQERIAWARLDTSLKKRMKGQPYAQMAYYISKHTALIASQQQAILQSLSTRWDLPLFD